MSVEFGPIESVAHGPPLDDEIGGSTSSQAEPKSSKHQETALIFGASLVLHLALAAHLRSTRVEHTHAPRLPQKVEIELARRPPKVLPPEPPKPIRAAQSAAQARDACGDHPPNDPARKRRQNGGPRQRRGDRALAARTGPDRRGGRRSRRGRRPCGIGPPAPSAACPIVEAKEGANYLQNPRPAYPKLASRQGWEGTVLLRVHVLPSGRPDTLTVQKTSGHDVLDSAATDAVRGWTFSPATQDGKPIAGWVNVPIVFRFQ